MKIDVVHYRSIAVFGLAAMTIGLLFLPDNVIPTGASFILATMLILMAISLPLISAIATIISLASFALLIEIINRAKIELTQFPLTAFDISIALRNPAGFFDALGISNALGYALMTGVATVGLLPVAALVSDRKKLVFPRQAIQGSLAVILALVAGTILFDRVQSAIMANPLVNKAWSPQGIVAIAQETGAVPFLTLSAIMPNKSLFTSTSHDWPSMTSGLRDESASVAHDFPSIIPIDREGPRPNVVVLQLESTFDINRAFEVKPPLKTELQTDFDGALLSGPLVVNAVGAGTWLTEFEVLTGLDWRWFGVNGYYTHTAIAPYMRGAFASYMRSLGYSTKAFYAVDGAFYGARKAYKHYGFEELVDGKQLGLANRKWVEIRDDEFVDRVIANLKTFDKQRPFYAHIVTTFNHAPHNCTEQTPKLYKFKSIVPKGQDCELNEYIARSRFTEAAVQNMERYLVQLESVSGTPYILIIYGDHLPHTFVGTGGFSRFSYKELLKQPNNETFYQVRTSLRTGKDKQRKTVTTTLIPTLISEMVRHQNEGSYLPGSLEMNRVCSNKLAPAVSSGMGFYGSTSSKSLDPDCLVHVKSIISEARQKLFNGDGFSRQQ